MIHFNEYIYIFSNIFGRMFQVKIWFQNHRYKCKRQAKEKAMAEQNAQNQVRYIILFFYVTILYVPINYTVYRSMIKKKKSKFFYDLACSIVKSLRNLNMYLEL